MQKYKTMASCESSFWLIEDYNYITVIEWKTGKRLWRANAYCTTPQRCGKSLMELKHFYKRFATLRRKYKIRRRTLREMTWDPWQSRHKQAF